MEKTDFENFINMLEDWKKNPESKGWGNKKYRIENNDGGVYVYVDNTAWIFKDGKFSGMFNFKEQKQFVPKISPNEIVRGYFYLI